MSRLRERAELRLARRMTSLPPRAVRRLAGPPVRIDGHGLNPQLQLILRLRAAKGAVGGTAETPAASRRTGVSSDCYAAVVEMAVLSASA